VAQIVQAANQHLGDQLSAIDAQVRFRMSAAEEVQDEWDQRGTKKNMNQPAIHTKDNPAKKPH